MTAAENIRRQLGALLEKGSWPRSGLSAAFLHALRPLLDAGVVHEERLGAGRRLVVRNPEAARTFATRLFPDVPVFAGASSRLASVAQFRDSKTLARMEPEMVNLRAWRAGALLRDGRPVDAAAATAAHGVFSFLLDDPSPYSLRGPCVLVENISVLIHLERLNLGVGLALWGRGRSSERLLTWLAGQTAEGFNVLHLPDYDPVGLSEHARLRRCLGRRVRLHLPADLPERFERFSNRSLLEKANNRALLANLRRSTLPEIRQVLDLIERHNAGLEHEALLLEPAG